MSVGVCDWEGRGMIRGASACDREGGGIIRGRLHVIGRVEVSSGGHLCDREGGGIIRGASV